MGLDDKIKNAAENAKGQGKEAAGKATNDEQLRPRARRTSPRPT